MNVLMSPRRLLLFALALAVLLTVAAPAHAQDAADWAAEGFHPPLPPQPAAPAPVIAGPIDPANVPYAQLIADTARRHAVSVPLLTALVWQESGFRPRARSRVGARGLTQLMPGTARMLGVRDSYDPVQNLDGGARYLRTQLTRFGSVRLALAAYNAGPGAVRRYRGIPPYRETRNYVTSVLRLQTRLKLAGVR